MVLQKNYSGETRHTVHQFTNDLIETLTGQKGIALSKVAFVADRTGHKEIYTCDYDGARTSATHSRWRNQRESGIVRRWPPTCLHGLPKRLCRYLPGRSDSGARNRIIKFPGTNSGAAILAGRNPHRVHYEQRWEPGDLCHRDQRRLAASPDAKPRRGIIANLVAQRIRDHLFFR